MTGYQNYARTDIQTSDPRAVIVLLYEGAIRFLKQAHEAADQNRREDMSHFLKKTQKIIVFLSNSLDYDQGPEMAQNLERLYRYMSDTLSEANLHCQPEKITEVIELLKPLEEAWREVAADPAAAQTLREARENTGQAAASEDHADVQAQNSQPEEPIEAPAREEQTPAVPSSHSRGLAAYGLR